MEDILTASQLIKALQAFEHAYGDLPVVYAEDGPFGKYIGIKAACKMDGADICVCGRPDWKDKSVICLVDDI